MNRTVSFDYSDFKRFQTSLKVIGEKSTLKAAKKAAQKGSNIVGKEIRSSAPKKTGQLKHGFKKKQEHSSVKGKYVYDYMMDPSKNAIFRKPIKRPGLYGGKNPIGYYPSSMEYGFLSGDSKSGYKFNPGGGASGKRRKGGKKRKSYQRLPSKTIPGKHFMRDATEDSTPAAVQKMSDVLNEELDKEWAKK